MIEAAFWPPPSILLGPFQKIGADGPFKPVVMPTKFSNTYENVYVYVCRMGLFKIYKLMGL